MSTQEMWNNETAVTELGFDVPRWIEQDITPSDIASILKGGCASGAYMPAQWYETAINTMSEHGDTILEYISDHTGLQTIGEIESMLAPARIDTTAGGFISWGVMACSIVSLAVELWASNEEYGIEEALVQ